MLSYVSRSANAIAVRGEWSRRMGRLPKSTPLGDLGVLAPVLADGRVSPPVAELVLGHYVDHALTRRHPKAAVIPITADPRDIIAAVASAGIVYTSSLHGLILADALGVPHVYERHPEVRGYGFKFMDYGTALGETVRPGKERLSDRGAMAHLQRKAAGWIATLQDLAAVA